AMRSELTPDLGIARVFIGHQVRRLANVLIQNNAQGLCVDGIDNNATLFAATLDQRDNLHLVGVTASALALLPLVAPIGFVGFHNSAVRTHQTTAVWLHGLANAMGHEPSRL